VTGTDAALACRAPNGSLTAVTEAAGFDAPIHLGGPVHGSPGVAATSTGTYYFRQGALHKPYFRTADAAWTNVTGHIAGGIQAVGSS
jgi:hypothetical protein